MGPLLFNGHLVSASEKCENRTLRRRRLTPHCAVFGQGTPDHAPERLKLNYWRNDINSLRVWPQIDRAARKVHMAMSPEMKLKAKLIGTALAGQSLENPCDESPEHDKALRSSDRDRRTQVERCQVAGHRTGNETDPNSLAKSPADGPRFAGIDERNAALGGESTEEAYRAALEEWLPWRPPGRRGWAYSMMEHAFFGLTRSRSPTRETDASDGGTEVKKGGEVQ
jgi:hypothetical protein